MQGNETQMMIDGVREMSKELADIIRVNLTYL